MTRNALPATREGCVDGEDVEGSDTIGRRDRCVIFSFLSFSPFFLTISSQHCSSISKTPRPSLALPFMFSLRHTPSFPHRHSSKAKIVSSTRLCLSMLPPLRFFVAPALLSGPDDGSSNDDSLVSSCLLSSVILSRWDGGVGSSLQPFSLSHITQTTTKGQDVDRNNNDDGHLRLRRNDHPPPSRPLFSFLPSSVFLPRLTLIHLRPIPLPFSFRSD
jgi:hypothetical protein